MSDYYSKSLALHKKHKGKLEVVSKVPLATREDLSLLYTPGVAEPSRIIAENTEEMYEYTMKGNMVAIITDGSSVLGLGNIGPEASLPVMEGKAILLKEFAGVDAFPICLDTQDTEEIIKTIKNIAPGFGGINLEDISAPRCFEIEERLQDIGIPVFHDDQHGTAIVVLAGLINALKVAEKEMSSLRIVINGAGAAGVAIWKILKTQGVKDIVICDSKGVIHQGRNDLSGAKLHIAKNSNAREGVLGDVLAESDVFIGVSIPKILTKEMVESMNNKSIVFALANPEPEILPDEAKEAGAFIVATGRSDFQNQVNNVLAFPGIFRGALDSRVKKITEEMKLRAAYAIAELVENPSVENILPGTLDKNVAKAVSRAVQDIRSNTISKI